MENFAKESSFSPEKWKIVVTELKLFKKEGRDINAILPDEVWNGMPIGQYLEELRQMRGEGKLSEMEIQNKFLLAKWCHIFFSSLLRYSFL